jgi:ADP-heptose:LPS heptosyltransferase
VAEVGDWAVRTLAAVLHCRPDLVGESAAFSLGTYLSTRRRAPESYRLAGKVLEFMLATTSAPAVVATVSALLQEETLSPIARSVALEVLDFAAKWQPEIVDLETAVSIVETDFPSQSRDFLRERIIERCIFSDPGSVTPSLYDRLSRLYDQYPAFAYLRYYLTQLRQVPAPTRIAAAAEVAFPLQETVARRLRGAGARVLVVQNIADGQGDEIIRTVPLAQAFLDSNPYLAVTLVTNRAYLYDHPRLTPVPIDDRERVDTLLGDQFDVIVDFYERNVLRANHDPALETRIQTAVAARSPFLHIRADKGYNRFNFWSVTMDTGEHRLVQRIDRQRVPNVYAPAFRLIAELGLPLRAGEDVPANGPVLAATAGYEADVLWARLTAGNIRGGPVALVNPFGGKEPLKGYTRAQFGELARRLRDMIAEGFFVVLLPNGEEWGTPEMAREVLDQAGAEPNQAAIAPDPRDGTATHEMPAAAAVMRLFISLVSRADLVVAVEGWMIHAAYCLGKPYRVLMLPYSHGFDWHPYGRTRNQRVVCGPLVPMAASPMRDERPLAEQPQKFLLRFILTALGDCLDRRALAPLYRAAHSEDRDLRLVAAGALARYSAPEIAETTRTFLRDPARRVRAAAASALLGMRQDGPGGLRPDERETLRAFALLGEERLRWDAVLELGAAARDAVSAAMDDEDPDVRRSATIIRSILASGHPAGETRLRPKSHACRRKRLVDILPIPGLRASRPLTGRPTVLILTPVKDAVGYLPGYFERLASLTYPHELLSVGLLESDSADATYDCLESRLPALRRTYRRAGLWKRDFGYRIDAALHRWTDEVQPKRRSVLARSRNHLLSRALNDEDWVLWLDVDVIEYPIDIVERLLATHKDIIQPHCVVDYGGHTFDRNAWREQGRLHLDDLRETEELVRLDAVGGTMLLVRADLHRDGLVFPTFPYGAESPRVRWDRPVIGELETEGLGIMAHDMGYECWGMPHLEIRHDSR